MKLRRPCKFQRRSVLGCGHEPTLVPEAGFASESAVVFPAIFGRGRWLGPEFVTRPRFEL